MHRRSCLTLPRCSAKPNRLYGFTAKQTLDYAQALYEKRLLTYPRTDSKYITSDMQDSTKELITGLCSLLPFMRDVKLQADLTRVCDNSKVTDHHAILPTAEFLKTGFSSLADSETKTYDPCVREAALRRSRAL